jgi:hypothetical protein
MLTLRAEHREMLLFVRCRTRGGAFSLTSPNAQPLSKQLSEMALSIAVAFARGGDNVACW